MTKKKSLFSLIIIGLILVSLTIPAVALEGKVNINSAPKEVLTTLKFIGDQYAQRIIEYRTAQKFTKPEEIMNVKGIGQKTYDANKDVISVKD